MHRYNVRIEENGEAQTSVRAFSFVEYIVNVKHGAPTAPRVRVCVS